MEGPLAFDIVWQIAIHPRYLRRKREYADELSHLVCTSGVGTVRESSLQGMMEVIEHVSNCILIKYGFPTTWYTCKAVDHPTRITALDLAFCRERN